ncbi:MAG: FKBP-type peptidyl-prolyl cis-trans isomerase [Sphingomonadales bacterium]|jgi:FKBP-type peptidyl-prolyl cis-trans isomerase
MKAVATILLLSFIPLVACRRPAEPNQDKQKWSSAHSVDFNQELSIRENLKIETFLAHFTQLKMTKTPSGLRYHIYHKGLEQLPLAKDGQQALVRLQIGLLDGTICYQTKPDEIERITIAHSEKESGIHEALQLLRKGDRAKLILPSYLGHGLLGDRMKIPPQSILYIDLELIDLQ